MKQNLNKNIQIRNQRYVGLKAYRIVGLDVAQNQLSFNQMIFTNYTQYNQIAQSIIYPTIYKKMRELIWLVCLLSHLSFAFAIDPPLLPEHFSQAFLIRDTQIGEFTTGKFWYDIKNNRGRADFQKNGYFGNLCLQAGLDDKLSSCSQVMINDYLYVWLKQKNLCCRLCTPDDHCDFIPQRDSLQQLQFAGLTTLSGEQYYKWTDDNENPNFNYFASLSQQRIPRRIEAYNDYGVVDFIMSSYSQEPINDQVFKLPKQCERQCPGPKQPSSLDSAINHQKNTKEQKGIFAYLRKGLQRNIKLKQN